MYDITPIFEEKEEEEIEACDPISIKWTRRVLTLMVITSMLMSMTFISWSRFRMLDNDNEIPTPVAMLNTCLNQSWNVINERNGTYRLIFYDNVNSLYTDSDCVVKTEVPYIYIKTSQCCRFVIWNTI